MHESIMAPRRNKNVHDDASGGRPTRYKSKYSEIAKRMCAHGATDSDLADRFGVSVSTIRAWQLRHAVFLESCKAGQAEAGGRVEPTLFQRATGYTYEDEKVIVHKGKVIRVTVTVYVPPDPRAGEFWLRHRRPDRWKNGKQLE